MKLFLERVPSPIGTILLVSDGAALRALDFEDYEDRMYQLLRRYYGPYTLTPDRASGEATRSVAAYFAGDLVAVDSIPTRTGWYGLPAPGLGSAPMHPAWYHDDLWTTGCQHRRPIGQPRGGSGEWRQPDRIGGAVSSCHRRRFQPDRLRRRAGAKSMAPAPREGRDVAVRKRGVKPGSATATPATTSSPSPMERRCADRQAMSLRALRP